MSISSTVPSKVCNSMVPSSSSIATTSKLSPPRRRYQAPISGCALIVGCSRIQPNWNPLRCALRRPRRRIMLRPARDPFKNNLVLHGIMFNQLLQFFVVFLVVVEPVSLLPLFVGLTEGIDEEQRRLMARRAVLISAVILTVFAAIGSPFLKIMGISLDSFRIFGGLLLFLIALEMVFARPPGTRTSSREQQE